MSVRIRRNFLTGKQKRDLTTNFIAPKQNDIDKIRWQSFLYADYNYLKRSCSVFSGKIIIIFPGTILNCPVLIEFL